MGFADGLGRFLSGKPVFQTTTPPSGNESASQQAPAGVTKQIPRVVVIRAETAMRGDNIDVSAVIKNESNVEVFVDKILLFGRTVELDDFLRPGEAREHRLYSGQKFAQQNSAQCELQYRKQDGDFFSTQHTVVYGFRDGSYVVDNIRPVGSVNDI